MALSKVERVKHQLDAAARVRGQHEFRCVACDRLLLRYTPPIGLVIMPCRRCGNWNELKVP